MTTATGRITSYTRDGLRFDVLDDGPVDGPVVVLLHGFPQLNTSWAKVVPLLHEAGLRTLAPNQRGYSPGARPRGRRPYRTSELVKDVVALVDEAGGQPVHLVGHDWGAAVAWGAAIMRPEMLRTLTAVSVPHPGAFLKAMPRGQILDSWYMALFNIPWLPERLLSDHRVASRFLGRAGMTPEMVARFRRDIVEGGALPGGLGWYRALPLSNRGMFGVKVRVPTTYVWSDHDAALGRVGAELTADYVDADYRFEVLEGVSHWIPDERPADLARIIVERTGRA
ncbi:alpha/beta fold hydrolase [Nocardioides terrisoli]|uniref:alpha/beta fold hydrolase n=1 Tax=Nocardioides terrisoli TaxID=3388267 RepID=UPI00287B76EB|nr:alpha/beta fold hydrolase [Nocardioides marmorisolisilvae]